MRRITPWTLIAVIACAGFVQAQDTQSIAQRTAGLERMDGFLPFYHDTATDTVLLEIPVLDEDVLYYVSIAQAAGSVELGLDRGINEGMVIHFVRAGPRVHVVQQNLKFRAPSGHAALVENVRDSFATSVLAALPIEAEEGDRLLVDATALFIRDAMNIVGRLRQRDQGTFRLDPVRSSIYGPRTKAFPLNTEVETKVTFEAPDPGLLVNSVTPEGQALTLRIHHSFLKAPEGYQPRVADPRIGIRTIFFNDYSAPFTDDTDVRWITRWRLEKQDPTAAVSEPRNPIVYYLDLAIPEPFRTAMRDGILWWNRAFEAAGFRNAVQVKDPPPDMDPMDIRYAFVLWVNRDERGFSSGGGYQDPRTGEILGSKTRMDSARIRTISHYWQSYEPTNDNCLMSLPPYEFFLTETQGQGLSNPTEQEMVLARQAVLTAHEVGHTLGFGHNWNSSINDRASVMEYPTPRVKVTANGELDLREAYHTDVGAYDLFMARYTYTEFPPELEREELEAIIQEMRAEGLLFTPTTDPRWAWYDDLATPTAYLRETMAARAIMLERYGPANLRTGEPLGELRDMRFWMAYLHHRWAIETAHRYIGGIYQNIVVKGENERPTEIVPADLQRDLLSLLLEAIQLANLAISPDLLEQLTADPWQRDLEDLAGGAEFDHLRAARILAALVIEEMLQPDRARRLIVFADRQANALTLPELLDAVIDTTWNSARDAEPMHRSLRRVTQQVTLDSIMILGAQPGVMPEVRAVVFDRLIELQTELAMKEDADPVTEAHLRQAERDIARYLDNPREVAPASAAPDWGRRPRSRYPIPPGPPLGGAFQ